MNRRTFLKKTSLAGVAGGIAVNLPGAIGEQSADGPPQLVAVKGGTPSDMFDKGIAELGGMKAFVKSGQTVLVKPNIGWPRTPETGANTNPDLVKRIIEHCVKAGAKKVYVLDHTCCNWKESYKKSGISEAASAAGAKVVSGNVQSDYIDITIPVAKKLKKAKIHKLAKEADVLINVPVLKNHGGAVMTCAMKNLMGIVWDRGYFHKNDLQQCIADFAAARKPDLNVVDAFRVMKQGGPRGRKLEDVVEMKYQLISTDMVAADAAASKILGIEMEKIPHIGLAEKLGLGVADVTKIRVKRIKMGLTE